MKNNNWITKKAKEVVLKKKSQIEIEVSCHEQIIKNLERLNEPSCHGNTEKCYYKEDSCHVFPSGGSANNCHGGCH